MTSIEEAAFLNCEKLEKLEMKSSHHLKSIGKDAFNGTQIESLCIGNDVEKLEEGWRSGLESLYSIYISVNKIYSYFGDKIAIENSDNKSSLVFAERDIDEEVSIPFIVAVRESVFGYCQNLRTIKFEERSNRNKWSI